jgi:hypothetical protein
MLRDRPKKGTKSAHQAAIMESDEFVRCPLCDGLAKVWRSDLIALLTGKNLREKLQKNMAEFIPPAEADQAARRLPGEFAKEVHNWDPSLPLWCRSLKE